MTTKDELLKDASDDFKALNADVLGHSSEPVRQSKYRNIRTEFDGRTYSSGKEAARAAELQLMVKAGQIFNLGYQVKFPLYGGVSYIADFIYSEIIDGKLITVVEDCKGVRTREYINKSKQFKTHYGITIKET